MTILAIDPGNIESGFCRIDSATLRPIDFGKDANELVALQINAPDTDFVVVERIASYGMAVGREVFDTCEWIGRFSQIAEQSGLPLGYVFRMDEKKHICHDSRAKDANIRRALIDRFAGHDLLHGKGTKKNPDFFYGFFKDVWAAYAVGLTYIETRLNDGK